MKNNWLLYLLAIVLVIGGVVLLILFMPPKTVGYDKLKSSGNRSYEVNISYSNVDAVNAFGEYDYQNNVLKYETDDMEEDSKSINVNLYDNLLEYLPPKKYGKDEKVDVSISANDLFKNLRFLNIRNEASSMMCEYEVLDNVIYSISCVDEAGGSELLNIDFMFD